MWGSNRVKGLPLDAREDPDRTLTGKGTTIAATSVASNAAARIGSSSRRSSPTRA